jgi:hypothetical protein
MKNDPKDVEKVILGLYSPNRFKASMSAIRSELLRAESYADKRNHAKAITHVENVSLLCIDVLQRLEEMKANSGSAEDIMDLAKSVFSNFTPEEDAKMPKIFDGRNSKKEPGSEKTSIRKAIVRKLFKGKDKKDPNAA